MTGLELFLFDVTLAYLISEYANGQSGDQRQHPEEVD
jgi:hypothetical protein